MLYLKKETKEKQERFWSDLRKYFLCWQDHLAGGMSLEHFVTCGDGSVLQAAWEVPLALLEKLKSSRLFLTVSVL